MNGPKTNYPKTNYWIQRSLPVLALMVATTAALGAQDASQSGSQQAPYQGVSHPPPDDTIITTRIPEAKPPAGQPLNAQPAAPRVAPPATQPAYVDSAAAPPVNALDQPRP